ncbi:AFG1 ATPase family protein [Naegleria gruberi]|uniref:AFG1 ATPase family protein n=1 Tax=Naegleria gruberi TaxID=5762 RepID=D2VAK1_NAEGR|nr:AFG1 ATPase family protein [Naegleria gruberi]EFC46089.1 AFG1 ATPase family protein [Naegleria gruberi]|eukprot:XP_002678833.1 AFG1 ATPase family protein [Naegleria gruberi strain NEG-M]
MSLLFNNTKKLLSTSSLSLKSGAMMASLMSASSSSVCHHQMVKKNMIRKSSLILPSTNNRHFSTSSRVLTISKHAESLHTEGKSPMEVYKDLVKQGSVNEDVRQIELLKVLTNLYEKLKNYNINDARAVIKNHLGTTSATGTAKTGSFDPKAISRQIKPHPTGLPKSLYIYGDVGCGKTFLMDMFFKCVPLQKKLRIHFNSFMIDFHTKMHQMNRINKDGGANMEKLMDEIADNYNLLCFDEFQVTDIGDAMILKRLFEGLLNRGVVVVKTSNRIPDHLYENGINREAFLPFIDVIKIKYDVFDMEAVCDYRLSSGTKQTNVYFTPLNKESEQQLESLFQKLTHPYDAEPKPIMVMNRLLMVPRAARGVAFCTFDFLCKQPKSAVDYIGICREFHTLIISGIPTFNKDNRDHMRRFITLIDELYQHRVKVICSAARPVEELCQFDNQGEVNLNVEPAYNFNKSQTENFDEVFAFTRTISRLMEMRNKEYLTSHHVSIVSDSSKVHEHV